MERVTTTERDDVVERVLRHLSSQSSKLAMLYEVRTPVRADLHQNPNAHHDAKWGYMAPNRFVCACNASKRHQTMQQGAGVAYVGTSVSDRTTSARWSVL